MRSWIRDLVLILNWSWKSPDIQVLISRSWIPSPELRTSLQAPCVNSHFFGDGQNLFLSLFLWMGGNFCEWGATFVNEGQILWMRVAGICAVCQSVGRCVCWQAGIPPRTKHCTCTWQCIFARWRGASLHLAVHLCTVAKSTAVANSRVHSYRFVHSLAWETLLTFWETRLVLQTLPRLSHLRSRGIFQILKLYLCQAQIETFHRKRVSLVGLKLGEW